MRCRRISRIINTALLKMNKSKEMKIPFKMIRNYLMEINRKLKKIINVFFLSETKKKKRNLSKNI